MILPATADMEALPASFQQELRQEQGPPVRPLRRGNYEFLYPVHILIGLVLLSNIVARLMLRATLFL